MWDIPRNSHGSDSITQKQSASTPHTHLRPPWTERPSTQHAPGGSGQGLGAENSSSSGFLVMEAGAGVAAAGRAGVRSAGTQATPLAFTYILASWSWGRETQVGLEIPEEKKTSPNT